MTYQVFIFTGGRWSCAGESDYMPLAAKIARDIKAASPTVKVYVMETLFEQT